MEWTGWAEGPTWQGSVSVKILWRQLKPHNKQLLDPGSSLTDCFRTLKTRKNFQMQTSRAKCEGA